MAQHDYVIDNQSAPAFRADLNSALAAVVSQNSGGSAPTATFANMLWYDTTNNQLKKRNEADSAWITLGAVDEAGGTFTPNGAGQLQSDWNTGTSTTESLISPAKLDDKIEDKLNVSGSAPIYAARAWVNFNGTGTVAIRASGNVASITDIGTGRYIVNFATAMADTSYCAVSSGATDGTYTTNPGPVQATVGAYALSATSCYIAATRPGDAGEAAVPDDLVNGFVAVFR